MQRSSLLFSAIVFLGIGRSAFAQQERMKGVNIGDLAPEIAMMDTSGDTLKLSQLRGQVVLVDFWASWCRPCRMENPNVVKAYSKYKDLFYTKGNGFNVFSVSLDRPGGLENWKNAIKTDSLVWKWHVGAVIDGNNTAAGDYKVMFIPTNVLIDGEGRVIGKDLRGEDLFQALNSLTETDPVKIDAMRQARTQAQTVVPAKKGKKAK